MWALNKRIKECLGWTQLVQNMINMICGRKQQASRTLTVLDHLGNYDLLKGSVQWSNFLKM